MKKEILAAVLLLFLFILSIMNSKYLSFFTDELSTLVTEAENAAKNSDWSTAEEKASAAIELWHSRENYTHIVMRHTEIDSVTTEFYGFLEDIYTQNYDEVKSESKLMRARLYSICSIEKIRFGSVF